uniref:NADH dehydrogenase subunit 4L n=1 Tax=Tosaphaedusa akiratadai TaxID=1885739 RepID=A0A224A0L5_9EUPU|nr:NADH dehydrogenase subunit 4L [Tosaphaedusa akiratadai]BBA10544.1 NADH dehydrogenase subunit 4L [Tosaphaedusa akiratadai]
MYMLSIFSMLMVFLLLVFFQTKKEFINSLLVLESLVLTSLLYSIFFLCSSGNSTMIFLLLLTLGVCEAGLGLALWLSHIKMFSSAFIKSSLY